jgi:hypothetical protein
MQDRILTHTCWTELRYQNDTGGLAKEFASVSHQADLERAGIGQLGAQLHHGVWHMK